MSQQANGSAEANPDAESSKENSSTPKFGDASGGSAQAKEGEGAGSSAEATGNENGNDGGGGGGAGAEDNGASNEAPAQNASKEVESSTLATQGSSSAKTGKSSEASASAAAAATGSASKSKDGGPGSASKSKEFSGTKDQSSSSAKKNKKSSSGASAEKQSTGADASQTSASKSSSQARTKSKKSKSSSASATDSASSAQQQKLKSSRSQTASAEKSKSSYKKGSTLGSGLNSKLSKLKSKLKDSKTKKSKSKSKSKSKGKSKRKSKSKDKSKSKEKSKSKSKKRDKSKSKQKSKSGIKSRSITSAKSGSKKTVSADMKLHKTKKIDLGGAKIGFVGAGKMTDAIVRGLTAVAKIEPKKIFVTSKSGRNFDQFQVRGITTTRRSYDIFGQFDCDVVFLCVHGFVIRACFKGGGTRPFAFTTNYIPNQKHPLYVLSLIGGVSLADIRQTMLDPDNPDKYMLEMHRVMLNIGVGYGVGMGALDVEPDSKQCSPVVRDLLTSITKLEFVQENLMDAACCLGGNGLAFCYYFIASIADGGFKMGLNKLMSTRLAAKALQSAAQCLLESDKHPSELQDSVSSQAGPTTYGIYVLDKADCAAGFHSAIETAYRRLKELVTIEPIAESEAKPF